MLKNYLLTAFKVYSRRKLFTAINLLCIVLTLSVLLVVVALLQTTFYPTGVEGKSDRFVQIQSMLSVSKGSDGDNTRISPLGYKIIDHYLRPMKSVAKVAAVTGTSDVAVYQLRGVTEVAMRHAEAEYWEILDFTVLAGRTPSHEDVDKGRFVVVINQATAKKLFPELDVNRVLGQQLNLGGQQFEVIGVVQDALHFNAYADVWAPITTLPNSTYKSQIWGNFTALLMAKNAADIPAIQAEVQQIAKRIALDDPKQHGAVYLWADNKLDFFARMLMSNHQQADSGASTLLSIIGSLMFLFMLLPALNLINLNTGRILERSSEIGVRKAFGATSRQLVGQFVIENILLCVLGGMLGLLAAKCVLIWLGASGIIPYLQVELSLPVVGYGLLITVIFGLLSGVIPAWKMSRLDPVFALKGSA